MAANGTGEGREGEGRGGAGQSGAERGRAGRPGPSWLRMAAQSASLTSQVALLVHVQY